MNIYDENTDEIISDIKKAVLEITSSEKGMPVYLKNVAFPEDNSRGFSQCIINVSCIFINEDGNVCVDLFRTGAAGFMECSYGSIAASICKKGLQEIFSALNKEKWYISETPEMVSINRNNKRKNITKLIPDIVFRLSFHMKG